MNVYEVYFHYGKQNYEFVSDLDLTIGKTYVLTNDLGHTYKSRAIIVDKKDVSVFSGSMREIVKAEEATPW
jgi:hypothetical protein